MSRKTRRTKKQISDLFSKTDSSPVRAGQHQANLPTALAAVRSGAVRIELEEGVPIFRASESVQARIEILLEKQRKQQLSQQEAHELDAYEEIDDYLSLLNRLVRDLPQPESQPDSSALPSRRKIPQAVRSDVRQRANGLCEYFHTAEQWQYVPFTMDHILPLAQGGTSTLDNLALACFL